MSKFYYQKNLTLWSKFANGSIKVNKYPFFVHHIIKDKLKILWKIYQNYKTDRNAVLFCLDLKQRAISESRRASELAASCSELNDENLRLKAKLKLREKHG